jgi:hypothetical protein
VYYLGALLHSVWRAPPFRANFNQQYFRIFKLIIMNRAPFTIYTPLALLLLLAGQSSSFAQSGGGSVRDTALAMYVFDCSGGGSVRDTTALCSYVAVVKTYSTKGTKQSTNKTKSEVSYYKINCNGCSLLQWSSSYQSATIPHDAMVKVKDTKLRSSLQSALRKKMNSAITALK